MKNQGMEREAILRNILGEFFTNPDEEMLEDILGEGRAGAILYALEHGEDLFHDPLTKVFDRRLLENGVFNRVISESQRYGRPIAVAMTDVDKFKQINDEKGHKAGDRVLQRIACTIQRVRREADVVIRYGGDEFLLILPETGISGARQLVHKISVELPEDISITAGFANWTVNRRRVSLDTLIERADKDLLEQKKAKGAGRG